MKNFYYMILCAAAILFAGCNGKGNEPEYKNPLNEKVYLKGFVVYCVPNEGTNYKFSYIGTKQSFIHTTPFAFETNWTEGIYLSKLPKQYILETPQFICERINMMDYEYFTCTVYYYSSSNPSGTQCLKQQHYVNEKSFIEDRPKEIVFTSNNGQTMVGALFEYEK